MAIIILGSSGFIGQHIVGCCRAGGIDVSLPDLDLCDAEQTKQLIPLFTPEAAVIMCAGIKRQWGDTLEIFRRNMAMAENVCALLEQHPVSRFLYMSSAAVYGEDVHNTSISEQTPLRLGTYYAISKYAAESLLAKACSLHPRTGLVLLRPPLVYGKGDTSKGYGPAGFLDSLLNDREITLWGDGSELREFLFAGDLARLVCDLAASNFCGVINPVSGAARSFREILEILAQLTGKTPRIATRARTKEKVDTVFNPALVRRLFPGFRFHLLVEGLREML